MRTCVNNEDLRRVAPGVAVPSSQHEDVGGEVERLCLVRTFTYAMNRSMTGRRDKLDNARQRTNVYSSETRTAMRAN